MDAIEEKEVGKYTVKLEYDIDPMSPREWDNLGTLLTWTRRYYSPDKNEFDTPNDMLWEIAWNGKLTDSEAKFLDEITYPEYCTDEEAEKLMDLACKFAIILPVFKYEHSGIAYNTSGFSCPWDSGQVGYIYVMKEEALKEWSRKKMSKKFQEKIEKILAGEVEEYSKYANGEVVGWLIEDEDGETIDSCWGYYDRNYAMQEGISNAEWHVEEDNIQWEKDRAAEKERKDQMQMRMTIASAHGELLPV